MVFFRWAREPTPPFAPIEKKNGKKNLSHQKLDRKKKILHAGKQMFNNNNNNFIIIII